jgi:hypothetical protein
MLLIVAMNIFIISLGFVTSDLLIDDKAAKTKALNDFCKLECK